MLGENREEYLEAIYSLVEEGTTVSASNIAKMLDIKPSSANEMLRKLDSEGFVVWKPYRPIRLTEKGYKTASKIKRKHRLLERFLHDVLRIRKSRVHEEACRMEHALSDEAAEALDRLLDHPKECPDNMRIPPAKEARLPENLLGMKKGASVVVLALVGGEAFKSRMRAIGIREGEKVKVIAKEPFGGPIVIKAGNTDITLGRGMASKILTKRI